MIRFPPKAYNLVAEWIHFTLFGLPNISTLDPTDLGTHILRLFGPKTILYKAFGLF